MSNGVNGLNVSDEMDLRKDDNLSSGKSFYSDNEVLISESPPQQQSNSVLMNLLVSGCDVSAGYVCLVKPKPSKSITTK